ncbi:hypothetical protein SNEBB_001013 [Seison nebaliae]|nr:hypothetical protein SNEBB_001013 [Seison nebaliae]
MTNSEILNRGSKEMLDKLPADKLKRVREIGKEFDVTLDDMQYVKNEMAYEMVLGLNPDTKNQSDLKMYPSFITALPSGNETGQFLALDIGGTNCRIILITLNGNQEGLDKYTMIPKLFVIENKDMHDGRALMTRIANAIKNLLEVNKIKKKINLGFTFSFPCDQKNLNEAYLTKWTKGFSDDSFVGKNVVKELQTKIDELKLKVKVVALINDTVGTLLSCAYKSGAATTIGLILGTGTNACYIEETKNIKTIPEKFRKKFTHMIVNMEWGAFGQSGKINNYLTKYDRVIDENSVNPKQQIFEKLISGMYMGEIVRRVIVDLMEENILFPGKMHEISQKEPIKMYNEGDFETKNVSNIETDRGVNFTQTKNILTNTHRFSPEEITMEDCNIIQYICYKVSKRAAYLTGSGLTGIMQKLKSKDNHIIGIDGSVYKYHPRIRTHIDESIKILTKTKFNTTLSEDGSSIGAAIAANSSK